MSRKVTVLAAAVFLAGLAGCGALSTIVRDSRDNARLAPYVSPVVYGLSRRAIFQLAKLDAEDAYRRGTKNVFFGAGRLLGADPGLEVRVAPGDRADIGALASEESGVVRLDDSRLVIPGVAAAPLPREPSQPIEIWGFSEIYCLEKVDATHTRVRIENKADRRRLYTRELRFLERVDLPAAEALKRRIRREHPEIGVDG